MNGTAPTERCELCRFDGSMYTADDVDGTLRSIAVWWDLATRAVDHEALVTRPAPGTWSALEYAQHTVSTTRLLGTALEAALATDALDFGPEPPEAPIAHEPATGSVPEEIAAIASACTQVLANTTAARSSNHTFTFGGLRYDPKWLVRHICHDALHHLHDIGRGLAAIGAGVPRQLGTVAQVNTSAGGIPKGPVDHADIGIRGLVGDRQRTRRHHGRVWQAVCLYSSEAIESLRAEGHPIVAGAAGENLTVTGVDWATLRPNTIVAIGDTVVLELTVPALPCAKNAQWFHDRDFMRMHHEAHPAETRWYARVVHDGPVRTGDTVTIEP